MSYGDIVYIASSNLPPKNDNEQGLGVLSVIGRKGDYYAGNGD